VAAQAGGPRADVHGPEYDHGLAPAGGHFMADLGFEHFFTGHGGLLAPGAASNPFNSSDHPMSIDSGNGWR